MSFLINPFIYASSTASTISLTNLVSYYKFNDDVTDSYGPNNGTSTGLTYNTGNFSNAGQFNGTTSRVNASDSASLSFQGSFSVNLWVYLNAQPATNLYRYITAKGVTNGWALTYRDVAGVKRFENYIFADGTTTNFSYQFASHTLTLSAWTMVTWVVTPSNSIGSKFKMYINGDSINDSELNNRS